MIAGLISTDYRRKSATTQDLASLLRKLSHMSLMPKCASEMPTQQGIKGFSMRDGEGGEADTSKFLVQL